MNLFGQNRLKQLSHKNNYQSGTEMEGHSSNPNTNSENSNKLRLWKQLPSKAMVPFQSKNDHISTNNNKDEDFLSPMTVIKNQLNGENNLLISQQMPEASQLEQTLLYKKKSTTISNFLKHLQIESKDEESRFGTDSEIVSIMDIKYNQLEEQQSPLRTRTRSRMSEGLLQCGVLKKSLIIDKKFQISMLFSALKQLHIEIRKQLTENLKRSHQEYQAIAEQVIHLISRHETQLSQKNLQIRTLELKTRELRLNNMQSAHRLQNELIQQQQKSLNLQSLNKNLHSTILQLNEKLKQSQLCTRQQKQYNRELNEMILKFHQRIEESEKKMHGMEKWFQINLNNQLNKMSAKYKEMMRQQEQNYELKLENNKILIMNMNLKSGNIFNASMSKSSDTKTNNELTSSIVEDFTTFKSGIITSRQSYIHKRFDQNNENNEDAHEVSYILQEEYPMSDSVIDCHRQTQIHNKNKNLLHSISIPTETTANNGRLLRQTSNGIPVNYSPNAASKRFERTNKCHSPLQSPNNSNNTTMVQQNITKQQKNNYTPSNFRERAMTKQQDLATTINPILTSTSMNKATTNTKASPIKNAPVQQTKKQLFSQSKQNNPILSSSAVDIAVHNKGKANQIKNNRGFDNKGNSNLHEDLRNTNKNIVEIEKKWRETVS